MAYELNKTDGTILTNLIDGQIDTSSTNLTLVGRNYSGYGEAFNENFIKLLENFANTAAPSNPLSGQTWWNTEAQRLQVYDGDQWKASGGPFVQSDRPQMVAGDLWINNETQQVFAYDGNIANDLILLGPDYTKNQGFTGFEVVSILDAQSRSRTIAKFNIGNTLVGVFSALEFTPIFSQVITELVTDENPSGTIFKGFNIVDKTNFKWYGTAESANALVTQTGEIVTAGQFLPSDGNGVTTGTLTIQNSGGLTIGLSQNNVQKVVGSRFYIENQIRDQDISLRVRSTEFESLIVDALYIDASTAKVGIFTTDRLPEYTLDVEGDLRVTGDLLVEGDTTTVNVATLEIEDKNIEIGKTTSPTDGTAEGGGITLKGATDKTLNWVSATDSWTANVNINLSDTADSYKIGGVEKLTNDGLVNVSEALDLTEIGTLDYLNVQNISIGDVDSGISANEIRNTGTNLLLSSTDALKLITSIDTVNEGTITVDTDQKIRGVTTPESSDTEDYVATKGYVDSQISTETVIFSMDVTGLGSGATLQNAVRDYLEDMYPAATTNNTKIARIHTTSYSGATVSGINVDIRLNTDPDNGEVLTKSAIAVDSNGTQNVTVIQDISATNTASGSVVLTPTRALMIYTSNGTAWTHQSTTSYP